MKIIALEEHIVTPEVAEAWRRLEPKWRDLSFKGASEGEIGRRLLEVGGDRLAAMDASGVDVQVLSLTTPGVQNLEADDARLAAGACRRRSTTSSPRPSGPARSVSRPSPRWPRPTPRRRRASWSVR